jgi:1,4-dihydroxy-2-naphthoyl-CoA synthase
MSETSEHGIAITVNDKPLELNAFASAIVANIVDAMVQSLRTEGEVRTIVITRRR